VAFENLQVLSDVTPDVTARGVIVLPESWRTMASGHTAKVLLSPVCTWRQTKPMIAHVTVDIRELHNSRGAPSSLCYTSLKRPYSHVNQKSKYRVLLVALSLARNIV
jgi:hypothetical protein